MTVPCKWLTNRNQWSWLERMPHWTYHHWNWCSWLLVIEISLLTYHVDSHTSPWPGSSSHHYGLSSAILCLPQPSWNSLGFACCLLLFYYLHILWCIPLTLPSSSYTLAPYILGFVIAHIYLTQKWSWFPTLCNHTPLRVLVLLRPWTEDKHVSLTQCRLPGQNTMRNHAHW